MLRAYAITPGNWTVIYDESDEFAIADLPDERLTAAEISFIRSRRPGALRGGYRAKPEFVAELLEEVQSLEEVVQPAEEEVLPEVLQPLEEVTDEG